MMRPTRQAVAWTETEDGWEGLDGSYLGKGQVTDRMFDLAVRVIDRSGVAGMVEEYLAEHAMKVGAGGRPLLVPIPSALVLMWLPILELNRSCQVTTAAELVQHRLTAEQRAALCLPVWTPFETQKRWIDRIHSSLDTFLRLIDPYWIPNRRERTSKADFEALCQARDPDDIEERLDRMYTVMNTLVQATVAELPWRWRAKFKGDRAVDGTSYKVAAKGTGEQNDWISVEPNAWWYNRGGDHKVEALKKKPIKSFYGYEGMLFTWTKPKTSSPDDLYPYIVDAIGFNPPGWAPAQVAVRAARALHTSGAPIGKLRADKQFWAGLGLADFHRPMWAMGFEAVTSYRRDQMGVENSVRGAVRIDGNYYCHHITEVPLLVSATADYDAGIIDYKTLQLRIKAREPFLATPRGKAKPDGSLTVACGASKGARSCLACALKNMDDPDLPPGAIPLPLSITSAGDLCDNPKSMTIPAAQRSKLEQAVRFMTPKWFDTYGPRNTVEGYNKDLKAATSVGTPGFRLRGHAANFLHLTLSVMSVNIHRISEFMAVQNGLKKARKRQRRIPVAPYSTANLKSVRDAVDPADAFEDPELAEGQIEMPTKTKKPRRRSTAKKKPEWPGKRTDPPPRP